MLFPSIGLKESERYLNNCAFSSWIRDFQNTEEIHIKQQKSHEHLTFLGGPANFTFDPSSAFIMQNIKNQNYYLISTDNQSTTENFFLSHGDKIYAVISKGNRKVLLKNLNIQDKNGQTFNFNSIGLWLNFNTSQKERVAVLSRKITMRDARLLSYLGDVGKNNIHHFLYDETQDFLHKNSSIFLKDDSTPSFIKQVDEKVFDIAPKNIHENYAEIEPTIAENSHRVFRKHKHSRYIFLRKKRAFSFNKKDEEDISTQLIIQLSNHLNKQLESFFHKSTIQISITEIGNFTFNG